MELRNKIEKHFNNFFEITKNAEFTINNTSGSIENWFASVIDCLNKARKEDKNIYFLGNGASASISSHFAADLTKNGNIPSYTLTDNALLTCFSNDYSYEEAYEEILKKVMKNGDILIAISSSGTSKNIVKATQYVKNNLKESPIITFTSFNSDNPLRSLGNYNLYLMSCEYSFSESGHAYYLHLLTDLFCNQQCEKIPETLSTILKAANEVKQSG